MRSPQCWIQLPYRGRQAENLSTQMSVNHVTPAVSNYARWVILNWNGRYLLLPCPDRFDPRRLQGECLACQDHGKWMIHVLNLLLSQMS